MRRAFRPPQNLHAVKMAAAVLVVFVLWGTAYPAIRAMVAPADGAGIPVSLAGGVRLVLAGLILFALGAVTRQGRSSLRAVTRRQMGAAVVYGLFLSFATGLLVGLAATRIEAGLLATLMATSPLWAGVISAVHARRAPPGLVLAGMGLGFVGVLVLSGGASPGPAVGMLLAVGGAVAWAAGSCYASPNRLPRQVWIVASVGQIFPGAGLVAVAVLRGETGEVLGGPVAGSSWAALGYLVALSLVGGSSYAWLLQRITPVAISTHAFVNPLVAAVVGWVVLGEHLQLKVLMATGLVGAGAVLILSQGSAARRRALHPKVPLPAATGGSRTAESPLASGSRPQTLDRVVRTTLPLLSQDGNRYHPMNERYGLVPVHAQTPPDYAQLSGPEAYAPVEGDQAWDPRFLELVKPERTFTFGDFDGVDDGGPRALSELALTQPFRVLTDEGVAIVQRIVGQLEASAITSDRTPKYVSGSVYRSEFLRGFYSDPSLMSFLSDLAQVPLSPLPVPYQALHLNFAPDDITRNVDKWHTDSVSFNWVMMVSDPGPMKGGELQAYLGLPEEGHDILGAGNPLPQDRIVSVDWPGAGWCVFQQGHRLLHQVTPLLEPYRRMTMVASYYTSVPGRTDPIDGKPLNGLNETADRDYTLVEWSRHKALLAAQELEAFAATKTDFRQPIGEVKDSLKASIADVERVLAAFDA